jgi:hypothetical protein
MTDRTRSYRRPRRRAFASSPGGAERNPGAGVPGYAAQAPLHPGYEPTSIRRTDVTNQRFPSN